ncbi:oxygen-insensitive NADPH nitroreductase [Lactococcus cremoris]|uniref:oxygen-insensitive NADPH nitroreductase n=1 Tax=Lactococcus lactis subsp. cremoris TaxID=1359 RepID=UPI0024BC5D89|nr:oxygen-insensitive NADPH nitroreductase [Lactococcus cremoris]
MNENKIMNQTIEKMLVHASVRDFKAEPLPAQTKDLLLKAAQSGASSNFIQAYSIIEVADVNLRCEIAKISGSDAYVNQTGVFYVFVADWYRQAQILRAENKDVKALRNMEALTVAIVDTTIAAQNMTVAAESMGLGICYIGGIRNDTSKVTELLNLPELTLPLFGLTIGLPNSRNEVKPRLPKENILSINGYNHESLTDLSTYNEQTAEYYANRSHHQKSTNWSQEMSDFLTNPRREDLADFLKKQGFTLD